MATVSVVLATHNGARFIERAIRSVLAQTHQTWELIIIDDASTDGTARCVGAFVDTRIKMVRNDMRQGLTKSLNRGIGLSRSLYIARLDDDDEWTDVHKLARQVAVMDQDSKLGLCGTNALVVDEQGSLLYRWQVPEHDSEIRQTILRANPFVHSSVLIRRSALITVGGYRENIRFAQDYELWLRLGQRYSFCNLPLLAVTFRIHGQSVSSQNKRAQFISHIKSTTAYRHVYPGWISNIPIYLREAAINTLLTPAMFRSISHWKQKTFSSRHTPVPK